MKYLFPFFMLTAATATSAAPIKIGDFELKRYSDEKSISKILTTEFETLGDATCISTVLDSQAHQTLIAMGRYVQAVTLKTVKEDEEPVLAVTFEYASAHPREASVVKKTLKCGFSTAASSVNQNNESGF